VDIIVVLQLSESDRVTDSIELHRIQQQQSLYLYEIFKRRQILFICI